MDKSTGPYQPYRSINRRRFIKLGATSAAALGAGLLSQSSSAAARKPKPRNILLIFTDQQHIDTIAAAGCPHVHTPALDRLMKSGVNFTRSYTANPVCSPARSAVLTGRTTCETDVYTNGRHIRSDIPNLGQWFSDHTDYKTFYAGKWHLPRTYTHDIPGFKVINTGIGGFGYLCDAAMSRACESFLRGRDKSAPFLLVASFMQPHDICEWLRLNMENPARLRYPELADQLPDLPENFNFDENEPEALKRKRRGNEPTKGNWSRQHWRYYIWSYYRNIEHVDAEIGRILRTLDDFGYTEETLIVLTSDHGEGLARHQMVRKSTLYDEAAKVPLIFSWPGHIPQNKTDSSTLVSGLDIMPTLCDYAGITAPAKMRGVSLRPILEEKAARPGEYIVSEASSNTARMVRTSRYKYIAYMDDAVEQLFDMKNDPGETKNLAKASNHAAALIDHRRMLKDWETQLDVPENVPNAKKWRTRA